MRASCDEAFRLAWWINPWDWLSSLFRVLDRLLYFNLAYSTSLFAARSLVSSPSIFSFVSDRRWAMSLADCEA